MYRSLLVPLDGSAFAEHALPPALAIARRAGAALRLASVATPVAEAYAEAVYLAAPDLQEVVKGRHRAYLEDVAGRVRARWDGPVSRAVLEGEVAETLCADVAGSGADLVVMATHGRGPLGRFWLGSVADELVRRVSVPLLLVRPREQAPDLGREPELGKVVVALDGTELAEQALGPAVDLAGLMPQAEVVLVRVIRPPLPAAYLPDAAGVGTEAESILDQVLAVQEQLRRDAQAYLAGVAERLKARGLRVRARVAVEEQPALALLHAAEEERAGLVALATHGRGGLARLLLGSVADKVIRGATVPVLVQRPRPR
jgi:nucleotide-binding universal stress UspA family protein